VEKIIQLGNFAIFREESDKSVPSESQRVCSDRRKEYATRHMIGRGCLQRDAALSLSLHCGVAYITVRGQRRIFMRILMLLGLASQ